MIAFKKSLFLGALLGLSTNAFAQTNLFQNGDFTQKTTNWLLPNAEKSSAKIVAITDFPTNTNVVAPPNALQIETKPAPGDKPWAIVLRQKLSHPFKRGESMRFRAWMRSAQGAKVLAFVESGAPDYAKSLQKELTLTLRWEQFEVAGEALTDLGADEVTAGFHLGYAPATIEIADVRLDRELANAPVQAAPLTPVEAPLVALPQPQNGVQSLLLNGDFASSLEGSWTPNGPAKPAIERVATGGPNAEFPAFARVKIEVQPDTRTWDSRLAAPVTPLAIAKGSVVGVRFWARSPQNARLTATFQESTEPYNKLISQMAATTPDWQEFRFYATTTSDLPALGSNFELHLGYGNGTIDIANVRVENYGVASVDEIERRAGAQTVDWWGGTKDDPNWKKAAFERIEKHRKAPLKIRVVDEKGKPIRNAKVKVTQTRAGFRWGSAVVAERLLDTKSPDNLRYQKEVERLFNTVVFENDLKWDNRNPRKTEQALEALNWIRARDMEVRGHTLVWGSRRNLPADIALIWDDTEKLRAAVRTRVREQTRAFKGQVYVWDAVNEAVTNSELWEKLGWDEFANVYKIAKEVDPNLRLAYNDYNIANENQSPLAFTLQRQRVAELIQILQKAGAPVDIYGDQAHFGTPLTRPARMVEIWNESAKLGLPIEITEFDAGIPDDKLHGEFVRDTMIAAFSQPNIESFISWGFWEGAHWRAKESGAMFRRDWTKRPAQLEYERLVLGEWRTNGTFQTDADGVIETRGFLGDYSIEIGAKNKTKVVALSLEKEGSKTQIAF